MHKRNAIQTDSASPLSVRPQDARRPLPLGDVPVCKGVWGKGVSKRKGPLEGIQLSSGNPMGPPGRTGLRAAAGQGIASCGARGLAGRNQREGVGPPEAVGRKARPSPKAA